MEVTREMPSFWPTLGILKEAYGPKLRAYGTYREVVTWLEWVRGRGLFTRAEGEAAAKRLGVPVEFDDFIFTAAYAENPLFGGSRPKKQIITYYDVMRWREGKHGKPDTRRVRAPFTPEEAEARKKDAMKYKCNFGCRHFK